ncbi:MAG: hypothetical protein UU47_C0008G0019 [candidate division TM6 bacterium GW2011_GWE2_41_16]|nr:MAG: hypothetical protein UU47_C0008G0019 [candidate division TM6 bacterium GW2011_GWE2_41_16]
MKKEYIIGLICGACFCAGLLWYAWHHDIVLIMPRKTSVFEVAQSEQSSKQSVRVYHWQEKAMAQETINCIWPHDFDGQVSYLTQAWLDVAQGDTKKPVTVERAVSAQAHNELFISFDRVPWDKDWSVERKIQIIESYLRILRENVSNTMTVRFLVHNEPMQDAHIDLSRGLPATGFSGEYSAHAQSCITRQNGKQGYTIVLDPSGDGATTGRVVDEVFERGLSLQFAQALKAEIEKMRSDVHVVLSRFPGEKVDPLQSVSFANRLQADLFVGIGFYEQQHPSVRMHTYFYLYNPQMDFLRKQPTGPDFIPSQDAYLVSLSLSACCARSLVDGLKTQPQAASSMIDKSKGVPLISLVGATMPSLYFEFGIHNKTDWNFVLQPVAKSLIELFA